MNREEKLALLRDNFDVLVIGGGATGLGIAVDAATRGFKTALIEAGDFAQATSSRSTKLVHGGVRYLASGQMHLVYEALHERTVMLHNAPHLVKAQPFIMPAYRWFELPYYGIGLKLYELISGESSMGPTRVLGRRDVQFRIPGIAERNLKGGILYWDGQFDDARFALGLARTAEDHGAVVLNYVRSIGLVKNDGKVNGAVVRDLESGSEFSVHARTVINATGIFVDEIRKQDNQGSPELLSLSRGTHVVVRPEVLGWKYAIMVPKTGDGRIIFAIPWLGKVIIGTTDLKAERVEIEPGHEKSEIAFLLETINPFLEVKITERDILSVFSGLRPLVTGDSKMTSKLSREHHIDVSSSGLITVAGGKWTTYRRMAEDTLSLAMREKMLPERPCRTKSTRLHGAPVVLSQEEEEEDHLSRYGNDAWQVRNLLIESPVLGRQIDDALPFTFAEVVYAVRHEMARTVEDVLSRRTRALFLNAEAARRAAPAVARTMAQEMGASSNWVSQQIVAFDLLAQTFYIQAPDQRTSISAENMIKVA
jgi:glycerol-3-phosphate dehydrogenase